MIESLNIKNVGLIEEIDISFNSGLNILSGETGAGKSMIIASINFLLGEKPSKDFIRTSEESAYVEGIIFIKENELIKTLEDLSIKIDDDNKILLSRSINRFGKQIIKANGRPITISMLKDIGTMIVDVHGQHEHQSLLNISNHIFLLDRFCDDKIAMFKNELAVKYREYKEILKVIDSLSGDEKERIKKIDLFNFQIEEIENANLKLGEEEELSQRKIILSSTEKLIKSTDLAIERLYGDDNTDEVSASDKVSIALSMVKDICNLDSDKTNLSDILEAVSAQINEVIIELRHYRDELEHDPYELAEIENRLNLIYNLKRKYGTDIKEILEYLTDIKEQINFVNNREEELKKLEKEKVKVYDEAICICSKISEFRKKEGKIIEKNIENILKDLGMKDAEFKINIMQIEKFSPNGFDKVEFMISPNIGEPLKSLVKIASGGEMSRVMLALKTVLADVDNIDTFIFDEIDTGVSGRTAQKVAEKLLFISKSHQIICITHLPQIASIGDEHFLIEKKSNEVKTITNIYKLSDEKSVMELARLIGGAKITEATIEAAREMKHLAKNIK